MIGQKEKHNKFIRTNDIVFAEYWTWGPDEHKTTIWFRGIQGPFSFTGETAETIYRNLLGGDHTVIVDRSS